MTARFKWWSYTQCTKENMCQQSRQGAARGRSKLCGQLLPASTLPKSFLKGHNCTWFLGFPLVFILCCYAGMTSFCTIPTKSLQQSSPNAKGYTQQTKPVVWIHLCKTSWNYTLQQNHPSGGKTGKSHSVQHRGELNETRVINWHLCSIQQLNWLSTVGWKRAPETAVFQGFYLDGRRLRFSLWHWLRRWRHRWRWGWRFSFICPRRV